MQTMIIRMVVLFVMTVSWTSAQASSDVPVPSADFGTPEGTAKIAAKAGFLDVVGIKLGMPVKDAVAALKAHDARFNVKPITLREYEALPGVVMTPVLLAANPGGPAASSGDDFTLFVTYAPNQAYLWGVARNLGFGPEKSRPTVENTLAGLRKKYGPESAQQANRLIWIYDAQGRQVTGAKAQEIYTRCAQTWVVKLGGDNAGGNRPGADNRFSNSFFDQQLKGGYYYGAGRSGSPGGMCHAHSVLDVYYWHAVPKGSAADLVSGMTLGAFNRQLEGSGVTAAHTALMSGVNQLSEKRRQEAEQRGGMNSDSCEKTIQGEKNDKQKSIHYRCTARLVRNFADIPEFRDDGHGGDQALARDGA